MQNVARAAREKPMTESFLPPELQAVYQAVLQLRFAQLGLVS